MTYQKLLDILEKNPFIEEKKLSVIFNKSIEEIRKKIDELIDKKIILGYKPVINKDKQKTNKVTAVIEVKITPEREGGFDRITRRMYLFPEVISCYLMSGAYDIMLFVEGENLQDVAFFVSNKLATIERVISTQTHFVLKTYKESNIIMDEIKQPEKLKISF